MSGNFDYVTYRPLNADVREDVGPEVADDDDDALLDVDATDVLNSRDLTLRMDTEDESDHDSDSVSLTPPSSTPSQSVLSSMSRRFSSRRNRVILVIVLFFVIVVAVTVYCAIVLS